MDYAAFTNDSLKMMYEAARGALAADDAAEMQGDQPPFRIRGTSAWMVPVLENANTDAMAIAANFMLMFSFLDWKPNNSDIAGPSPIFSLGTTELTAGLVSRSELPGSGSCSVYDNHCPSWTEQRLRDPSQPSNFTVRTDCIGPSRGAGNRSSVAQ